MHKNSFIITLVPNTGMARAEKNRQPLPGSGGEGKGFAGRELLVEALGEEGIAGFRIVGTLGKGGQGVVYDARDAQGNEVALKLFKRRPEGEIGFHLTHWFLRECAASMILSHENIVPAIGSGITESHIYLAMKRIRGKTLCSYITNFGPLDWATSMAVMSGVLAGMEEMHRSGVIHRDLKPENIIVSPTNDGPRNPRIADFGLCHIDGFQDFWPAVGAGISVPPRVTPVGACFATPEFRAPEFVRDGANRSPAYDIYAAGLTFYNAVAGRLPFLAQAFQDTGARSDYYARIHASLSFPPPSLICRGAEIPERAERALMASLDKDPLCRPTAAEFRKMIQSC